jgi:hypothetical protein
MAVLFTFGVVFQLSDAILGLTILAWGNSVGGKREKYFIFLLKCKINIFPLNQISLPMSAWQNKICQEWDFLPALVLLY